MDEDKNREEASFSDSVNEVTRILNAINQEGSLVADELIPLVYNELRSLARHKMSMEESGQTLQATALVHEAYLKMVRPEVNNWNNRQHFFRVAAEAMRRILIDNARKKKAIKRGGGVHRTMADLQELPFQDNEFDAIDLDEALEQLSRVDQDAAEMVKLRFFAGLTLKQIAEVLNVSPRKVDNLWVYSRAWLYDWLKGKG